MTAKQSDNFATATATALASRAVRLITVPQAVERHPAFEGRIRGFIVRADRQEPDYAGLRAAIVRIGRSVYLDEYKFLDWVDSRRAAAPDAPRNPHGRAGK